MTWNYRIIRKTKKNPFKGKSQRTTLFWYDLHEVYYNKKGRPIKWTLEPVAVKGFESVKDLRMALAMMMRDVVDYRVAQIKKKGKKEILVNRETRIGELKR